MLKFWDSHFVVLISDHGLEEVIERMWSLLDLLAGPGQSEAPPCPWNVHSATVEAIFLGCSLEIVRCWDHLDSGYDWTPIRLLYKLSRFGRWVQRSIHLTAPKTSLVCHFPWLLNHHLPIWSGLPLSSVSPWLLCVGTISDSTWGSPRLQTNIMLFHLPWKLFLQAHFMPGNIFLFSSDRWNIISWGSFLVLSLLEYALPPPVEPNVMIAFLEFPFLLLYLPKIVCRFFSLCNHMSTSVSSPRYNMRVRETERDRGGEI